MRTITRSVSAALTAIVLLAVSALAAVPAVASITPTLSLAGTGDGNTVQVTVNGDANAGVVLFYQKSGLQVLPIGTTNASGTLSTTVSSSQYGIVSGTIVYVAVGGISGVQSQQTSWPSVTTTIGGTGTLSYAQTALVVDVGQTATVNVSNPGTSTLYVGNNSNPTAASTSVNGNTLSITGLLAGTTTITTCALGQSYTCPNLYVTVLPAGAAQLSFSQSSVVVSQGQSVPVTISGGNGVYAVRQADATKLATTINGSILTVIPSMASGSTSVTVCTSDNASCGVVTVTIGTSSTTPVSFSQTNPSVSVGQSTSVFLSGGSGTYYVSSNSSPNIVQANMSGNALALVGIQTGTSTVNVCSSTGGCNSLTVSVGYGSTGPFALSQSTLSLMTGQTLSLTISGGSAPYNLPTPSSSTYQASISGNVLSVTGVSAGTSQVAVCSSGGACIWLSLLVNGGTSIPSTSSIPSFLTFTQQNLQLSVGQSASIGVFGGPISSYAIAYNSNSAVANASISGTTLSVTGAANGIAIITVCATTNNCGAVPVAVGTAVSALPSYSPAINPTPAPTPVPTPASVPPGHVYVFKLFLSVGSTGTEVSELQTILTQKGYYSGPINGRYGPLTEAAVKAFQRANKLTAAGYVGPGTRAALNGE